MSLRLKIAFLVILAPGLMAAVLLGLLGSRLSTMLADAGRVKSTNDASIRQALADREERLAAMRSLLDVRKRKLDEILLATAQAWVRLNLGEAMSRRDLIDRLRDASMFRSVVHIDLSTPPDPPMQIRPYDADAAPFELGLEEAALVDRAFRWNSDPVPVMRDDVAFIPLHTGASKVVESVLRVAFDVAPMPPVPAPDQPQHFAEYALDFDGIQRTAAWTLGVGLVCWLVLLLWAVQRTVLAPVRSLVRGGERVAAGDFSLSVPQPQGNDEIAQLVRTFNHMQERIRLFQEELENKVLEASERIRDQDRSLMVAQRLAATGTLAAGLAHEINNPLGGMLNAVSRLRNAGLDARNREYLDLIDEGLSRIQNLMRQILDFSRRREHKPAPVRVGEVLRSACELVRWRFGGEGAEAGGEGPRLMLASEVDEAQVFGDAAALGQVLLNLIMNARDAIGDNGTVWMHASEAAPASGQPRRIEIRVTDDGQGMDDEVRERIFDPFFTTKPQGKGTGLGLAIVHAIVQDHAGTIRCSSAPGKGTTFTLSLPTC